MFFFEYLNKNDFSVSAPELFFILHTNMSLIAPTGNTYNEDYLSWSDAYGEAFERNENRKIVLIKETENKIVGFFAYSVSEDVFKMEEIQILPELQSKYGIFKKLYLFVFKNLPPNIKYVEAFANKKNKKSIAILKHLGLEIIGTNKSGSCHRFRGSYNDLLLIIKDLFVPKKFLISGNYTCVVCKGKERFTSDKRGVKPLVSWYKDGADFTDFSAADKVVGRATAFLYVLLGVRSVYAGVISKPALEIFQKNGIEVEFGTLVDNIINRAGDGICPFEAAVMDIECPEIAYSAIINKMQQMNIE